MSKTRENWTLFDDDTTDDEQIIARALQILEQRMSYRHTGEAFTTPDDTKRYCKLRLAALEYEVFGLILLDNRHRLIEFNELFRGTIDGCAVPVREVVKAVLGRNAAAVILTHNHPSGVAEPSQADMSLTRRLREALSLIDVRVLDHLVIGDGEPVSFAERGLL